MQKLMWIMKSCKMLFRRETEKNICTKIKYLNFSLSSVMDFERYKAIKTRLNMKCMLHFKYNRCDWCLVAHFCILYVFRFCVVAFFRVFLSLSISMLPYFSGYYLITAQWNEFLNRHIHFHTKPIIIVCVQSGSWCKILSELDHTHTHTRRK